MRRRIVRVRHRVRTVATKNNDNRCDFQDQRLGAGWKLWLEASQARFG